MLAISALPASTVNVPLPVSPTKGDVKEFHGNGDTSPVTTAAAQVLAVPADANSNAAENAK